MYCDHDLLASVNAAPEWVIWVVARREAGHRARAY
jgi:hypothetical protein